MKKLLTWLWFGVYVPANIRIGIVYGLLSNVKFIIELVIGFGVLWFYWFKVLPTHKQLLIISVVILSSWVWLGDIMLRNNIPQKMTEISNRYNPQISNIDKVLENTEKLLKK